MVEKSRKQKRGSISEEDISTIFQRYSANTVLALLQEVAQVPGVKIDWNTLVKKTTTGIGNPREYQMLWRHLAYRDSLLGKLDDGAEPLDDDSDLEYELEAFPTVSSDAATEAAACVKVLIASGLPSDSNLEKGLTVEAPLTINIPNGQSGSLGSSQLGNMKGTNITVPVSVQKQPLPTVTSAEGLDANGAASGSLPSRRKRKKWSDAEDWELYNAVKKCGEGNWANILKGDFKGDRTASQLSQRWTILRKKKDIMNLGSGSYLSEAHLATRRAMSLALNMPIGDNLKGASSIAGAGPNANTTPCSPHPSVAETSSFSAHHQTQAQQDSTQTAAQRLGTSASSPKSRVISKKQSTKPSALTPDAMVKAAAVAAGARIATPSDAASLLKAAQAKNAIHIMPGGGSLIKPSTASSANPLPGPHLASHSNVHYVRNPGLASAPLSSNSTFPTNTSKPHLGQGHSAKPVGLAAQSNVSSSTPGSNASPETNHDSAPLPANGLEAKTTEDIVMSNLASSPKDLVKDDQIALAGNGTKEEIQDSQVAFLSHAPKEQDGEEEASVLGNTSNKHVQEDKVASPSSRTILKRDLGIAMNSKCSSSAETAGNDQTVVNGGTNDDNKMALSVKDGDDNQSLVMEICEIKV